jgi:endonuclease YncB( thermonuclease family)
MRLRKLVIFLIIILLLALLSVYWPELTGKSVSGSEYEKESVFVTKVIDGDTIVVTGDIGNDVHVRLLGINNKRLEL